MFHRGFCCFSIAFIMCSQYVGSYQNTRKYYEIILIPYNLFHSTKKLNDHLQNPFKNSLKMAIILGQKLHRNNKQYVGFNPELMDKTDDADRIYDEELISKNFNTFIKPKPNNNKHLRKNKRKILVIILVDKNVKNYVISRAGLSLPDPYESITERNEITSKIESNKVLPNFESNIISKTWSNEILAKTVRDETSSKAEGNEVSFENKNNQISPNILRDTYGDVCLKLAVRKCYKALVAVIKNVCKIRYKCKSGFKSHFKMKSKEGCIQEFDFSKKTKTNKMKLTEYEFVDATREGYLDACIPFMVPQKKNVKKSLRYRKRPYDRKRSKADKKCQKLSRAKCVRACYFATQETCSKYECRSRRKKALKKDCKTECKRGYRIYRKDSSSRSSETSSDSDD